MKKRLKGLIAGLLIGAILASGVVFAKQVNEMAELYYNNIKIFIDGSEIVPKDANGNAVEPFIVNGSTYLPVRAVANAFGKDVEWDGATQSVYIGKKDQTKPDNYLQKIQYNDYKECENACDFTIINGTVTDYNNTVYTSGILFLCASYWNDAIEEDSDKAEITLSYPLNSQYENFNGKIVIPKSYNVATWDEEENPHKAPADVFFYGDGKLLHKATYVTSSMPFAFDIDVRGVNELTIKLKAEGDYAHIALTDLALYK